MGTKVKRWDPYKHLDSVHTEDVQNQRRASPWFDMTLVEYWTRPVHDWMLAQRKEQIGLGRIIPQVNEEYGYEEQLRHLESQLPELGYRPTPTPCGMGNLHGGLLSDHR